MLDEKYLLKLYMAYDESNHGRFPEICASVFSTFESDVLLGSYKKVRSHEDLFNRLKKRDYSFLLANKDDLEDKTGFIGEVISSLLYGKFGEGITMDIFIDGEWARKKCPTQKI